MRSLSVPELLGVWERGLAARPFEWALSLLSAAAPESSPPALARLSIGRRDALLFQLREWAFGSELPLLVSCPQCQQALEMTLPIRNLQSPPDDPNVGAGKAEVQVAVGDYEIRCRPPSTEDLGACAGSDLGSVRANLFARCVTEALHRGQHIAPDQLPQDVAQAVVDRIAAMDPQADIRIDLACPDCQHGWSETFDIVSFFWTEIDAWARHMLRDVHVLASAYGWRESDILALSPARRQIYLAMAQA